MSTRSLIGEKTGEGTFRSVFCHWDGHPERVGKSLYDGYNGFFEHDLARMTHYLIDSHPAGWESVSGCDFSLEARYVADDHRHPPYPRYNANRSEEEEQALLDAYLASDDSRRPMCRCHGDADCLPQTFTEQATNLFWAEYLYILDTSPDGDVMLVCTQREYVEGRRELQRFGPWSAYFIVALDGLEPDWELVRKFVHTPGERDTE